MSHAVPARKLILYYSHTRQVSGGERVLLMMLQVLNRELYEPICACPFTGKGNLDELLRDQGVPVLEAPVLQARFTSNPLKLIAYLASFWSAIRAFRGTIAEVRPDLLHANSVRAGIVATLATLGTKTLVLWHIHDDLPPHPISKLVRQLAFRSARSRFVAVSHATARVFAGDLPFGFRLQVVHNAVDVARFPRKQIPPDRRALAFREEMGLRRGDFLAVSIGMINPRKGQLELVQAWLQAGENLRQAVAQRSAHLAIVGAPIFNDDHLYEQQIKQVEGLSESHFPVHFTGPRADVPAILRAADVLILNANVEPFGLVILEAMASGTAVIATQVGGIPELITDDTSGITIPSPDNGGTQALTHQLVRAYWSPGALAQLAQVAYTQVLPQFTIPVFAANLQALYTSLNLGDGAA